MSGRFSTEYLSPSRWSPSHWARGLAWPILERLGRLDSGSNPDGPTLRDDSRFVDPGHRTSFASLIPVLNPDGPTLCAISRFVV